jgi:hypothetical protein
MPPVEEGFLDGGRNLLGDTGHDDAAHRYGGAIVNA